MNFSGKVAIVTGGAKGLGRAICEGLLDSAAKVCFADVQAEQAKTTLDELQKKYGERNVVFHLCDISDQASFESTFMKAKDTFGRIDILICNAGIIDEVHWEKILDINLKASISGYYLATKYLSLEKEKSPGAVVFVSSIGGIRPLPELPVYCATKAGLIALARSFGHSSVRAITGISVNAVCPGGMSTGIPLKLAPFFPENKFISIERVESTKGTKIPEVVETILKLIKDDSTGTVVAVAPQGVKIILEQELF